jgi:hypothetical protein
MRCLSQGTVDVVVMGSHAVEWTGYPAVKCAEIRERVRGGNWWREYSELGTVLHERGGEELRDEDGA